MSNIIYTIEKNIFPGNYYIRGCQVYEQRRYADQEIIFKFHVISLAGKVRTIVMLRSCKPRLDPDFQPIHGSVVAKLEHTRHICGKCSLA